jgi:hypothetical protein
MTGFEHGMHERFSSCAKNREREWFKNSEGIKTAFEKRANGSTPVPQPPLAMPSTSHSVKTPKRRYKKYQKTTGWGKSVDAACRAFLIRRGIAIEPIFNKPKQKQIH